MDEQMRELTNDAVIDLVKEAGLDWHAGFNLDDENRYGTLVRLAFNLGAALSQPAAQTMDQSYGDGSNHVACSGCGLCVPCGDCRCPKAAAQGDSSHSAGGECGGVPAPDMDLVNLARRAIDKHWGFEILKYSDDLYGKEHLADAVWDFVEECQSIGRTAFDKKYPEAV